MTDRELRFLRNSFANDHPTAELPRDLDTEVSKYAPPDVRAAGDEMVRGIGEEVAKLAELHRQNRLKFRDDIRAAPLDALAAHIRLLTYGEMIEFTQAVWAGAAEDQKIDSPAVLASWLHAWAKDCEEGPE
jgi:hypothetical protein